MNVLVLNPGSESLRFEVIRSLTNPCALKEQQKIVSGIVEGIGRTATLSLLKEKRIISREQVEASDYGEAAATVLAWLDAAKSETAVTGADLEAVGHRVVHGGDKFSGPVLIDEDVIARIRELEDLAPLHNAAAIKVINTTRDSFAGKIPMVAVFDTVFHQSLPDRTRIYPLPFELSRAHHIRRHGFHGIAHQYLTRRYATITGTPLDNLTAITLHLESGSSACAIKDGKSVDTSMGFTPLEGLMMGRRSGDIDPSIVLYLLRTAGIGTDQVEDYLNRNSGLLGVSGRSHDTRELMKYIEADDRVHLAMEMYCYRLRKYIGAYLAVLNGAEAVIFGGGIGENTPHVRLRSLAGFDWCGLTLDEDRNNQTIDREGRITTDDSRIHAYVIPVEEGLLIAQQVAQFLARNGEGN